MASNTEQLVNNGGRRPLLLGGGAHCFTVAVQGQSSSFADREGPRGRAEALVLRGQWPPNPRPVS